MKFMLMMHAPRGTGDWGIHAWSPTDFQNHIAFMKAFNADLTREGVLVAAEGLAPPDQARLVRAGDRGTPITDGPFAETKEFLAGFWMVDVESAAEAYAIAARASLAPGKGGAPLHLAIEVREVMSGPPPP